MLVGITVVVIGIINTHLWLKPQTTMIELTLIQLYFFLRVRTFRYLGLACLR